MHNMHAINDIIIRIILVQTNLIGLVSAGLLNCLNSIKIFFLKTEDFKIVKDLADNVQLHNLGIIKIF